MMPFSPQPSGYEDLTPGVSKLRVKRWFWISGVIQGHCPFVDLSQNGELLRVATLITGYVDHKHPTRRDRATGRVSIAGGPMACGVASLGSILLFVANRRRRVSVPQKLSHARTTDSLD